MGYAKNGGLWLPEITYVKSGGVWQTPKDRWVKKDGVWKQLIPYGVLNLRSSVLGSGDLGVLWSAYLNKFVIAHTSGITGTGGTDTHSASGLSQSSATVTSATLALRKADSAVGFTDGAAGSGSRSHTHTLSLHSHNGNGSQTVTNCISYINFIPYLYSDYFSTDSVIFHGSSIPTDFAQYGGGYHLRLASSYGTRVGSSHYHGSQSGGTGTGAYSIGRNQKQKNSGSWYPSHYHTTSHNTPSAGAINPSAREFKFLRQTTGIKYLNDLPAGSIILSTVLVDIEGWDLYTTPAGRHIKSTVNAEISSGTPSHSHNGSWNTPNGSNTGGTVAGRNGSKSGEYKIDHLTHTHSYADNHGSHNLETPPYVKLAMYKKAA